MQSFFSPQTRAQIEIGLEIAELAKEEIEAGDPMLGLKRLINQCLKRDEGWKAFYGGRMSEIGAGAADPKALTIFAAEQKAEIEFQNGRPETAVKLVQQLVDQHVTEPAEKGWYLQEIARYTYLSSKTESNTLQIAAHKQNRYLLKPRHGMTVTTIAAAPQKRIERIIAWANALTHPNSYSLPSTRYAVACASVFKPTFSKVRSMNWGPLSASSRKGPTKSGRRAPTIFGACVTVSTC